MSKSASTYGPSQTGNAVADRFLAIARCAGCKVTAYPDAARAGIGGLRIDSWGVHSPGDSAWHSIYVSVLWRASGRGSVGYFRSCHAPRVVCSAHRASVVHIGRREAMSWITMLGTYS